ncbi:MAG TPA: phosphoesterase, partial [bacterium]|nr:phosphoesterase [bacterium]
MPGILRASKTAFALAAGALLGMPPAARALPTVDSGAVRLLPPSGDARAAAYAIPAAREPHLSRKRLLALLGTKVKYVFVLFQENRSFDFCYGSFPGVDGLYTRPGDPKPGFTQFLENPDGSRSAVRPFRVGPRDYAADLDDVGHAHGLMGDKMDVVDGVPRMDHFALAEEEKHSHGGSPTLQDKQFGELTM